MEIKQTRDKIFINQELYAREILKRHNYLDVNGKDTPMMNDLKLPLVQGLGDPAFPYRQLVGELFYLVTYTRPDLAQSVGYLSRFTANPTEEHWKALIPVLRYLRKTLSLGLSFNRSEQPELHAFSDSDFAGDKNDYKSTSLITAVPNRRPWLGLAVKQSTWRQERLYRE